MPSYFSCKVGSPKQDSMNKKTSEHQSKSSPEEAKNSTLIQIKYPLLWLLGITFLLYVGSLNFGFTELDDTIFVTEIQSYNEQSSNLIHSFKRGVFSETNDTYYRPMLMDSFILNHMFSGTDVKGYHAFNLIFHLLCVVLLFLLLIEMGYTQFKAFCLSLLFAIHPVLSQAVAWIPGRNDTIMTIFILLWMMACLKFEKKQQLSWLIIQCISLLAALFTKETALFALPAFFILWHGFDKINLINKSRWIVYTTWIASAICWFLIRQQATIKNDPLSISSMASSFLHRFFLAIQYVGKIILPFNLSVFPMMAQTSYLFGALAIILLVILILLSKQKDWKKIIAGKLWFMILLFPLFILPASLNDQDFEHRLYLPIIGILIVLGETALFQNFSQKQTLLTIIALSVMFIGINYFHQQKFKDPLSFWTSAVETTPESAYANMMLAARLRETDSAKALQLMNKAYKINPKEKYVNYYLGKDCMDRNSLAEAETYFKQEINNSDYFETSYLLSRVYFLKNDTANSIKYLEYYLKKDPTNAPAINNLVLMMAQTNQKERARNYITQKQQEGMNIPLELINLVKE